MSKYLVIGGNGVIGHFLTRQIVAQGHRPVVMSRSGDSELIRDIAAQCDIVRGDITDVAALEGVVRAHAISAIAHLGASLPAAADKDPALGMRVNSEGTANLLAVALRHNIRRVIMASSKNVYGPARGRHADPEYAPIPEDHRPDPRTIYGIGKLASEFLGRWYVANHGLEFAALRFGATVGPGKITRHGGSYSRYNMILESAMAGRRHEVPAGGDALCDTIFNDDAARGMLAVLQAPSLKHDLYNVATGSGISLKDYAAAAERAFPGADLAIGPGFANPGAQSFILDVRRMREEFGFVADPDPDRIVARYVETMKLLGLKPAV